jgi:hypothetical protein
MTNQKIIKSVLFPVFGSFPNVLNFSNSYQTKPSISNSSILFILDKTGSMGDHLNENHKSSKMYVAKELIKRIISLNPECSYDIMPFNNTPLPLCHLDNIDEPSGSTYFSPLVPELQKLLSYKTYDSVIFLSDGLPSESVEVAHRSIKMIGSITRENKANPVAVAIGVDADGEACALFAGSRGYNCFIKYEKDLDDVANDINHGINCIYEMLETVLYVPVESDGTYYWFDSISGNNTVKADRKMVEKYLNLVIMKYLTDTIQFPLLKSLVEHSVLLLENENDRKEIIKKYDDILKVVKKTANDMHRSPGVQSAVANVYRAASQQV